MTENIRQMGHPAITPVSTARLREVSVRGAALKIGRLSRDAWSRVAAITREYEDRYAARLRLEVRRTRPVPNYGQSC